MIMTNRNNQKNNDIIMCTIDELVPQDHLVRILEATIDWKFIYPLVRLLYSNLGRHLWHFLKWFLSIIHLALILWERHVKKLWNTIQMNGKNISTKKRNNRTSICGCQRESWDAIYTIKGTRKESAWIVDYFQLP